MAYINFSVMGITEISRNLRLTATALDNLS